MNILNMQDMKSKDYKNTTPMLMFCDCELQSKNCCKNLTYQKSLCTTDSFSKSTGVWRYMNFLHTRTIFLLNFLKCIHNKTTLNVKILVCYFIHTLEAAIISSAESSEHSLHELNLSCTLSSSSPTLLMYVNSVSCEVL